MTGQKTGAATPKPPDKAASFRLPADDLRAGAKPRKSLFRQEGLSRADMARLGIWGVAGLIAVLGAVLTANEMSGVRRASQAADVRMKSLQDIADGAQREALHVARLLAQLLPTG